MSKKIAQKEVKSAPQNTAKIRSLGKVLKKPFKLGMKFLSDLLFPEKIKCMFCGEEISDFANTPYCDKCAENLVLNIGKRCAVCDVPLQSEAIICDFCQKHHRSFKRAFCPFIYEGQIQSAILSYKNENKRHLATGFAQMLANRLRRDGVKVDVITYVPMTKQKEKARSFNQSKLLAEKLCELLNVPLIELFTKTKDVTEQKSLTYKERQNNARDSYALVKANAKNLGNVLIVDDVITTCATIDACAKLLANKAKNVYVCAIARQYVRPPKPIVINRLPFQIFSCENKP